MGVKYAEHSSGALFVQGAQFTPHAGEAGQDV